MLHVSYGELGQYIDFGSGIGGDGERISLFGSDRRIEYVINKRYYDSNLEVFAILNEVDFFYLFGAYGAGKNGIAFRDQIFFHYGMEEANAFCEGASDKGFMI